MSTQSRYEFYLSVYQFCFTCRQCYHPKYFQAPQHEIPHFNMFLATDAEKYFQINATKGKNIFMHLLQLLLRCSNRPTLLHAKYVYTILNDLDNLSRKKLSLLLENYIHFLAKILWTFLSKFAFYSLWRLHCQQLVTPLRKFKLI